MSSVQSITMHFLRQVIGARHLSRQKKSIISPYVEVELVGLHYESGVKLKTKTVCTFCYKISFELMFNCWYPCS